MQGGEQAVIIHACYNFVIKNNNRRDIKVRVKMQHNYNYSLPKKQILK